MKPKRTETSVLSSTATSQLSGLEMCQLSDTDTQNLYQALHVVVPGACIFTSVSVPSSEPELDSNMPGIQSGPDDNLLIDDVSVCTATVTDQPDVLDVSVLTATVVTDLPDVPDIASTLAATISGSQPDDVPPVTDLTASSSGNDITGDYGSTDSNIPAPLTALYQAGYELMNDEELATEAERLFCEMTISDSDFGVIKEATVAQNNCAAWTEQRKGRLTASLFHDVFVRKPTTDPVPLLKKIMGYEQNDLSYIPSIRWGIQNENTAREKYATLLSTEHENFTCNLTGLWVNPLYPHLGVSPDGVTSCSCHGDGLLEIKCPYSSRDTSFLNKDNCSFLTESGYLNRKHRYYTQVQGQLMVSGLLFCDFFVWTPSVCKVERVYPDVRFWEKLVKQLTLFFVTNVLPEIMTQRLLRSIESDSDSDKENIYCICQKGSAGRMVACDNQQCHFKWFHYSCVGIKRAPKGSWFCSACKKSKQN